MDRKKNRQGKLPMWQERLRRNSAAMREEFEQMDKRTALYNGTREIDGGTGGQQLSHAEGDGKKAGA